jgi:hypothetical protein
MIKYHFNIIRTGAMALWLSVGWLASGNDGLAGEAQRGEQGGLISRGVSPQKLQQLKSVEADYRQVRRAYYQGLREARESAANVTDAQRIRAEAAYMEANL